MKSELKFNSQICTRAEQSQRLLDLGLKPETADMILIHNIFRNTYEPLPKAFPTEHKCYIPAWSLHRLIEMYNSVGDGSLLQIEDITYKLLINCICMAIATGSFPKQYLNE